MAIKVYSPVDFEDTSSGLSIDGDFAVDTNTLFVDASTNRVGIRTTSPAHPLNVVGDAYIQAGHIHISQGSYRIKNASAGTQAIGFPSSGNFAFENVNVGIGTTSPATLLHINNGSASANSFRIENSDGYGQITTDSNVLTYDAQQHLFNNRARSSEYMRINSSGNVLIGTTTDSGAKLEVAGSVGNFKTTGHQIFLTRNGNNEIYAVGASSVLALGTNSAEKMRITSTGNVGIGTTSPLSKLHSGDTVSDYGSQTFGTTAAVFSAVGVNNSAATMDPVLKLMKDGVSGVRYAGTAVFKLGKYATDGVNPRTRLDIALGDGDGNTEGDDMPTVITIQGNGNVGIGTTSPSYKLEIKGTSNNIGDGNQIFSVGNTSGGTQLAIGSSEDSYNWIRSYESGVGGRDLALVTNGEAIRIKSGGNVLIGTNTDSGYKLDIDGTFRNTGEATVGDKLYLTNVASSGADGILAFDSTNTASGSRIFSFTRGGGNALKYHSYGYHLWQSGAASGTADSTSRMILDSSGRLGIGTSSPDRQLQVHESTSGTSTAKFTNSTTGEDGDTGFFVGINGSEQPILFGYNSTDMAIGTNGTERMRITSGGNVGIGTASPAYKLDVTGELRATSVLRANSNTIVGGYLDLTGDFFHRDDIKVLNKAANNWLIWAQRDTAASEVVVDLNYIGTITPGSDSTYDIGSSSVRFANGYFDTLYGDGSNLTGITATETDTLDSVTGRGATTTNSITVGTMTSSKTEVDFTPTSNTVALDIRGTGTPNDFFTVSNATGGANDVFLPIFFYKAATYGYNGGTNRYPSGVYGGGFIAAVDDTSKPSSTGAGAAMHFNSRAYANNGALSSRYLFSWGSWTSTYMTMTAGGNLLIGTTTDSGDKLQVNGDAKISGDLEATGDFYQNGTQGWSGTINIPTNPPISITVQGGIITNVT